MTNTKMPFAEFIPCLSHEGIIFGGYVRDYLLGVQPKDIDIMVHDIVLALRNISYLFKVEVLGGNSYGNGKSCMKVRLSEKYHNLPDEASPATVDVDLVTGPVSLDFTVNGLTLELHRFSREPHIGLLSGSRVFRPLANGGDTGVVESIANWSNVTLLEVMVHLKEKRLVPLRAKYSAGPSMGIRRGKMKKKGFRESWSEPERSRLSPMSDIAQAAAEAAGTEVQHIYLSSPLEPDDYVGLPVVKEPPDRPWQHEEDEIPF